VIHIAAALPANVDRSTLAVLRAPHQHPISRSPRLENRTAEV
jgi:hypothetical protein